MGKYSNQIKNEPAHTTDKITVSVRLSPDTVDRLDSACGAVNLLAADAGVSRRMTRSRLIEMVCKVGLLEIEEEHKSLMKKVKKSRAR